MSVYICAEEQLLKMRGAALLVGNLHNIAPCENFASACFLLEDSIKDLTAKTENSIIEREIEHEKAGVLAK